MQNEMNNSGKVLDRCGECGKYGHKTNDCWGNKRHSFPDNRERRCFMCGQVGHLAVSCPKRKGGKAAVAIGKTENVSLEYNAGISIDENTISCYTCSSNDDLESTCTSNYREHETSMPVTWGHVI